MRGATSLCFPSRVKKHLNVGFSAFTLMCCCLPTSQAYVHSALADLRAAEGDFAWSEEEPGHVGTHGSPRASVICCSAWDQEEPLTHSEVGSREGVGGAAVLADDGGGVALLAVVVTSASHAGQLADGRRENHLDPPRVVANCTRQQDTSQQQTSEERRVSYSPVHRQEENKQGVKRTLGPGKKDFEIDSVLFLLSNSSLLTLPPSVNHEQQRQREKKLGHRKKSH